VWKYDRHPIATAEIRRGKKKKERRKKKKPQDENIMVCLFHRTTIKISYNTDKLIIIQTITPNSA